MLGAADEVTTRCSRCDAVTTHRRDAKGILRCVRCVLEDSLPPNDAPTPIATPVVEMPAEEPRRRMRPAEMIAAVITVLVVGFLIYAFAKGH